MSNWPFTRILVANRGEIAVRIIQACQEVGIESVAVYSEADLDAPHVKMADAAYAIGPALATQSYLNIARLIEVAQEAGAGAVHPGYGFLAENPQFARACREAGLIFIGPSPEAMEAVGGKIAARALAESLNVPVVPGVTVALESLDQARSIAETLGYPVAIKASAGGGGRGLKVAYTASELATALESAQREGAAYFADSTVFMERYLTAPRHIEVQIAADQQGTVISVGTRECSTQRNHQKLIEEAPAPVSPEITQRLLASARRLAQAIGYTGAGTAEFLVQDDEYYFLEMNTRIQVEHTVTEMVTGLDLVKMQLAVAAGEPLPFSEADCLPRGHAIECRINAEDPAQRFRPGPGLLSRYRPPTGPGIRIDSGVYQGYTIPSSYDSMIAKLMAWGRDREEARLRLLRALAQLEIAGVPSTIPFHQLLLNHPAFMASEVTTNFLETLDLSALPPYQPSAVDSTPTVSVPEMVGPAESYQVEVNGKSYTVRVASAAMSQRRTSRTRRQSEQTPQSEGTVRSPMFGVVIRVAVEVGAQVSQGDLLFVIEAMKMENEMTAPRDGVVESLLVNVGQSVEVGTVLATLREDG